MTRVAGVDHPRGGLHRRISVVHLKDGLHLPNNHVSSFNQSYHRFRILSQIHHPIARRSSVFRPRSLQVNHHFLALLETICYCTIAHQVFSSNSLLLYCDISRMFHLAKNPFWIPNIPNSPFLPFLSLG